MENKTVKYKVIAIIDNENVEWEFDTLHDATYQYNEAKKYKGLKDLKIDEIVTTVKITNII